MIVSFLNRVNDRLSNACLQVALLSIALLAPNALAQENTPSPEDIAHFEKHIRPVLADSCYRCHSAELSKEKGGLTLDTLPGLLNGGDSGPAITPGNPDQSLLLTAITYEDPNLQMPPKNRLPKETVEAFRTWILRGAPWPGSDASATHAPTKADGFLITEKDRNHWAFQPPQAPSIPTPQVQPASTNPIDLFVLSKLQQANLQPSPPATPRELLRRAVFDLTGLPPDPARVERYLNNPSPNRYEELIEELLNSPQYGEKWGRHWLDLVRYAESNSYERDNPKPNAWRYRDYVVQSLNADKPFNRFITEQLAGDELPGDNPEAITATGYYRLGIWDDEPTDREQARLDGLDDIITTTSQTFLGLTLDCARCHDHKIDPFPQSDYYRLLAFFDNINHYRNGGPTDEAVIFNDNQSRQHYEDQLLAQQRRKKELQEEITELEHRFATLYEADGNHLESEHQIPQLLEEHGDRILGTGPTATYKARKAALKEVEQEKVPVDKALCVTEAGPTPPATHIRIRGNAHVEGDEVQPGFPSILGFPDPQIHSGNHAKTTGRRSVLANWIASPQNPLTARVLVNRVWQHHFGRGLVRTPNDFGLQGAKPTHPGLLDWLSLEFVRQGWSLKHLHRLIMTSQTYQMASNPNAEALAADPENDLFWRFNVRRLTAEEIRDSILAITGELNPKMAGPSIYVKIPDEILAGQSVPGRGWGESPTAEQNRRSIYIHVKRSLLSPILEGFDLAETDRTTPVRFTSVQPTQALNMLNSDWLQEQAGHLARRIQTEYPDSLQSQIQRALYLATARNPEPHEINRGLSLVQELAAATNTSENSSLHYFCLMVLNLNETVYLD